MLQRGAVFVPRYKSVAPYGQFRTHFLMFFNISFNIYLFHLLICVTICADIYEWTFHASFPTCIVITLLSTSFSFLPHYSCHDIAMSIYVLVICNMPILYYIHRFSLCSRLTWTFYNCSFFFVKKLTQIIYTYTYMNN